MKTIWVIGDSFSTNLTNDSWVIKISNGYNLINLSRNGISEYRIYKIFLENMNRFKENDIVILCHTNPLRIYIPDSTLYPTRTKESHPECDLVIGDIDRHGLWWKIISYIYFRYFYDEEYLKQQYRFIIQEMENVSLKKGCKVIHISGFENVEPIISIYDIFQTYKGNINHLDIEGNRLVFQRILPYLKNSNTSK